MRRMSLTVAVFALICSEGCVVVGGRFPVQNWGPEYNPLTLGIHVPMPLGVTAATDPSGWLDISYYLGASGGDTTVGTFMRLDEASIGLLVPIGRDDEFYSYIGLGASLFLGWREGPAVSEMATAAGFFLSAGLQIYDGLSVTLVELRFSGGAPMELGGRSLNPTSVTGAVTLLFLL